MMSSEAELASKQEQLQNITERLQSFSGPEAAPLQSPDTSPQVTKLEEKIRELELERNNLKKVPFFKWWVSLVSLDECY